MGGGGRRNPDRDPALSIVAWSAASGLLLGLFVDAMLVGIWVIVNALAPGLAPRLGRTAQIVGVALLVIIPAVGTTLGFLEGRLKLR